MNTSNNHTKSPVLSLLLILCVLFIGKHFLNINYLFTGFGLIGLGSLWYLKNNQNKIFKNTTIVGIAAFFASCWWVFLGIGMFKMFLFEQYLIPSESMYPTYQVGDYIVARKFNISVQKGNVLIFKNPDNPQESYVKRVMALSGDKIHIQGNYIVINGNPLNMKDMNMDHEVTIGGVQTKVRDYQEKNDKATYPVWLGAISEKETKHALNKPCAYKNGIIDCIVPKDHVFMMGDNRRFSYDSRYMGAIHKDNIEGIVIKHWGESWNNVPIYQ